ncbi:MAG: hypothetical protein ACLQVX_14125 [Limisphaerales bacterium]
MKRREMILLGFVGCVFLLFIGAYGIRTAFVKPLKELKGQIGALGDKLRQYNQEKEAYLAADKYLKDIAPRVFGHDADTATAEAGKMLTDQILRLGLQESQFSRMPAAPRRLRGAQEVGWSVQGEGPLPKMIDLIFTLEQTPQVHRIENLVLSAGDGPGRVKARFRYITLVVEVAGIKPKLDLQPKFALDSPQRRLYDAIVQRDLLRPYVPRPPGEAAARSDSSPLEALRVVSLSNWGGVPEVHVCDTNNMKVSGFKAGDSLAGGQIVMIDYRTLPVPSKAGLVSNSRVIIQIGTTYWAVEHGQTLSTKYQLAPDQLPPELRGPTITYEPPPH